MHTGGRSARIFISYAHDDERHEEAVRSFWTFLVANGMTVDIDLLAANEPQEWRRWMNERLESADFILVIASPEYRRRAENRAEPEVGRGVLWEAELIGEMLYTDREASRQRILPVLLPGRSVADLPTWLTGASRTVFPVRDFTVEGAIELYRWISGQPLSAPEPGPVRVLPAQAPSSAGGMEVRTPPVPLPSAVPFHRSPAAMGRIRDAMLAVPELQDEHDRQAVLSFLPHEARSIVPFARTAHLHLLNVLLACARLNGGRDALLGALQAGVGPSLAADRMYAVIQEEWPQEPGEARHG